MKMVFVTMLFFLLTLSSPLLAGVKVYCNGVDGYEGCEDTYMIDYRIESNFGEAIYIECQSEDGREGGSRMRPLIRFNHLNLSGCKVRACTLQLYCYLWIGRDQEIHLHEALRDWEEFETTCIDFKTGSSWAEFACGTNDIDASSSHVCSIVDSAGVGYKSFALPASLVQGWVDAPGDVNNGLLVLASEQGLAKDRSFRSSDMFVSSLRPRLIVHYDSCAHDLEKYPVLLGIDDVPDDTGGVVRLTWTRSIYDAPDSDTPIKRYKIWRKRRETLPPVIGSAPTGKPAKSRALRADDGRPAWEVVARVLATGACEYTLDAQTYCDSSAAGISWSRFYVSACTGSPGVCFDSPVGKGYSVNNLLNQPGHPPDGLGDGDLQPDEYASMTFLQIEGPNPGSDGFTFRFGLARPDYARVRVYGVSGRVVETLLDTHVGLGPHTIRWDCSARGNPGVPPGVYILNLVTSTESRSEKLVVLR